MFADALRGEARAAYRRQLHALLGIPEDATTLQMHELVVAGFPARDVAGLYERGGVPMGVRDWIVSPDAFEVRVCEGRLTVEESDRLFRAVRLIALAQGIFGEHEKALRWLSKLKERFAGEAPFAMLTTMPGMYAVEEMLLQGAEGIYA
ncbi:antitoxin Xre/MbcA/ParS toxin-binding domain-containing protein [Castellaniella sp.]|uniref:antitoxin Xre/MbcA/ParS toxin-binding domain-containing protein n=1 Tax=Castellaniella sp. TaxID=1955812 RepID=UPI003C791187